MKRACIIHDWVNLALVPLIGAMTIAGLAGFIDPAHVTHTLLAYVVGDFLWVALQPEAVPSLPTVILAHHAVTCVLLCIPLRHPHLHWYTCVDGLVELNTFFLIARRQWRSARRVFSWLYWSSFLSMRMVLYPLMVPVFWHEMRAVEAAPWWEVAACVGAQVILCGFNVVLLALSVMNWRKRRASSGGAAAEDAAKAAAGVGAKACVGGVPIGGVASGLKQRRAAAALLEGCSGRQDLLPAVKGGAPAGEAAGVALKVRAA